MPQLADAGDLERWADTRGGQAELPVLVRRLIRAENDQVQRLEMRGGDGVGLTGYDGIVEASRGTSFVPDGASVWEMGVSGDIEKKAQSDYRNRKTNPLGVDCANTTFVFVTPRRWEGKKDWEDRRRKEGVWRDIRVLDADDIELAFEVAPAVHVWFSELVGKEPFDATSLEDWWARFARGFDPTLTSSVVLAGREDQASAFVRRVSEDTGQTFISAASVDDGLAFAASAMMATGPDQAEPMLSRSMLVHEAASLRRLDHTSSLLILLPYEERLHRDAHLVENHHVVFVITEPDGAVDIELPPLDHLALKEALRGANVPDEDLDRFARAGNKSLLRLRRVTTRGAVRPPQAWSSELSERLVRRAWLAGAWNQTRSGDVEVIEALTESSIDMVEERLGTLIRQADPLFTKVGATWAVAAPKDSWGAARLTVNDADLQALERTVQTVLGAVDPRLDLPADERWLAAIHGKSRVHSRDLRRGISRSLAVLGTYGDDVRLSGGRSGRQWADRVTWSVLGRANEDASANLWASVEDVAPLLAEAAPDVFLRALGHTTKGPDPLAAKLFQDADSDWNASSPHTGILWALELLAWSDQHLGYTSEILAELAEIDPGGRLSNRPKASLTSIFRPWAPQTAAPLVTRVQTLDALIKRHTDVAWDLLLDLLPDHGGFALEGQRPRFRDWADGAQPVPAPDAGEMFEAIAVRILQVVEQEPNRWLSLVPNLPKLPPQQRQEAISLLSVFSQGQIEPSLKTSLWEEADSLLRRHREFPDSAWALSEEWLSQLDAVVATLRPSDALETSRWLFDDWHPDIGGAKRDDFEVYDAALAGARQAAVEDVLAGHGVAGVIELARNAQLPWAVGSALAAITSKYDLDVITLIDVEDGSLVTFADSYIRTRFAGRLQGVRAWVDLFEGRPLAQARLLQTVQDLDEVWALLASMSPDVEAAYWSEFSPFGRGTDFPGINEVATHLITHGRAAIAVDALSMYASREGPAVRVEVVVAALAALGTNPDDPDIARVSDYDITRLLGYLQESGVDEDVVARFEWKFLPLLHGDAGASALQRSLARDPEVFVDLINLVFKPANNLEEDREPVAPNVAQNAFRLLREWRVVPGSESDGRIDAGALGRWLAGARELLAASDRLEIGELQIGEVLAHAPQDPDGTFPTLPVRDVLELAPNDRLERGFAIGLFNKRGVTSRGLTDGGKQEYALADQYEGWALAVQATHPRTAAVLRQVASGYREDGRRNDDETKRFLEGLEE